MIDISSTYNFLNGAWHLVYYIPKNRPFGSLSDCILKFKDNNPYFVDRWSKWACIELSQLNLKFDFIIRALGSNETTVSQNKPLDVMGKHLGRKLNSIYNPEILRKIRETPPMHTLHTVSERKKAIEGSYAVNRGAFNLDNKRILIIDDVTTSTTTIREIIRALVSIWPNSKYYLFCLGKTSYDINANGGISLKYLLY